MRRTFYLAFIMSVLTLAACENNSPATQSEEAAIESSVELTTDGSKLSYGLGQNIGNSVLQQAVPDLDMDALVLGVRDAVGGIAPQVSEEELQAVVGRIQEQEEARMAVLAKEQAVLNDKYLSENGEREEITTTESGLQYEVLTSGDGAMPKEDSVVRTHYHGTLLDGTVFDSSVDRGQPAEFPLNQVISGWTEALQLMKVGDKWRLYLPPQLAYGESSPGPLILPNSALIFEVELLDILDKTEPNAS